MTPLEIFLNRHDDAAWRAAVVELLPETHEVDRNAVQVWFHFFPIALLRAFERAEDKAALALELQMQGRWLLKDQIDSSHIFLYGHRFWPEARAAAVSLAESGQSFEGRTLAEAVREVARAAAAVGRGVDSSLLTGIAAVALMTLQQVGLDAFRSAPGRVMIDDAHAGKTPEQILRDRARDDSQGLLGFLRTTDKRWTVVWDENKDDRRFRVVDRQEVASGAATDKRPWHEVDSRCTVDEGPIPVQCRSASCGTCWVGVLGGAEKLSAVEARERKLMPLLGYIETDDPRPLIRLSSQAQATGAVSIVIPPWNGYFGKYLKRQSGRREAAAADAAAV
jgi:ferredoxin